MRNEEGRVTVHIMLEYTLVINICLHPGLRIIYGYQKNNISKKIRVRFGKPCRGKGIFRRKK